MYNRLHEHWYNLKNNRPHNKHLQASWNKHGEDSFIFNVIEYCSEEKRFEREQYYIDTLKPEYNLTLQVEANFGHKVTEETKTKISQTLKDRYSKGEITAYRQEHLWIKTFVYNIQDLTFCGEFDCRNDALKAIKHKKVDACKNEGWVANNKYMFMEHKFKDSCEFINYINKTYLASNSKFGKYIITEDTDGNITYYKYLTNCAIKNNSSKSTLGKHHSTKESPYIISKSNIKFYYSDIYYDIKYTAVPIEESLELLQTNIGESPTKEDNTEINSESKESESSYSIGIEPSKEE